MNADDFKYLSALYYAETYGDLTRIVGMLREGRKEIIENEKLRNFIADRLEKKPMRGAGKKPRNQEKENIEYWVVVQVAIFVLRGLPMYHGKNSGCSENESAFSNVISLASKFGYKGLTSIESIKNALKNYFAKSNGSLGFFLVDQCQMDIILRYLEHRDPETRDQDIEIICKTSGDPERIKNVLEQKFAPYFPALNN